MKRGSPFDCSLKILALRDHSEAELRRKLSGKGYEEGGIEESVARLKELGYLNDLRFARSFAASALRNGRGYGGRLKLELSRRGVEVGIAAGVLAELSEEYEERALLEEIMARRHAGFDPATASEKEKRKVVGYLQRRGFSLCAIFAAFKGDAGRE